MFRWVFDDGGERERPGGLACLDTHDPMLTRNTRFDRSFARMSTNNSNDTSVSPNDGTYGGRGGQRGVRRPVIVHLSRTLYTLDTGKSAEHLLEKIGPFFGVRNGPGTLMARAAMAKCTRYGEYSTTCRIDRRSSLFSGSLGLTLDTPR